MLPTQLAISLAARMLRLPPILAAGMLGLFGILMGFLAIVIHLTSVRSFGAPYLEPTAPFFPREQKDVVVRVPWWAMRRRPSGMGAADLWRERGGMGRWSRRRKGVPELDALTAQKMPRDSEKR